MTTAQDCTTVRQDLVDQLSRVVAISPATLEPILIALIAGGHVLIEGVPGTGKTLLARALAVSVDCDSKRIQFTNDLMPSDIVGGMVWRAQAEKFSFVRGPLFTNIVLADEVNRTSPRTLSCLLEAMENGSVTVEGRALTLGEPFFVLATRNPIEFHGTYPVPEAALDRFLVRVSLDYPSEQRELELYRGADPQAVLAGLRPVLSRDDLKRLRAESLAVEISEPVARYCYAVIKASRDADAVQLGASPRAALAWLSAARARALLDGRSYVVPDDLKATAEPVLGHRIILRGGGSASPLLGEILARVPVEL